MKPVLRAALVLAAALVAAQARAAEVIHSFVSDVTLARDGELAVTETLRVRAEGSSMRHGIYRDFPMLFRDAQGREREVFFKLVSVARDGRTEPYHTERQHNYVRIYAGSKDVVIAPGEHTYVFVYRTSRQVRWFDGKPELNWNVTGNFWRFPIEQTTYRLHLADDARPTRWTAFTGPLGARGRDFRGDIGARGVLTVSATRRLAPGEGLTVVAALPDGAVMPPSESTELWYRIYDNRHWIVAAIGLVLVLGYYLLAWARVGRDPQRGIVIPLFHPPQGISPALANYVHNWGLGRERWRAFTAAALSLEVKGLMRLDQADKTLTLKATGSDPKGSVPLSTEERAILSKVNVSGGKIIIGKEYSATVADLGKKFTTAVETENANRFFRRNIGYVLVGAALTIGVVVWEIAFGGLRDQDIAILIGLGMGGFFLGMFVMPIVQSFHAGTGRIAAFVWIAFVLVFVSFFVNVLHGLIEIVSTGWPALRDFVADDPFPFVLVTAFAAVNGLFLYLMRAPTALGRPVMDALDGLKLYLETAEKDRLNMQAPELTVDRFETLLPYAVALDVEKPWADAFAAALKRAHPDDPDPMAHYQPGWSSGGSWSGRDFGSAVASSIGSMSSALASAAPASSGSSGFSSGGGGSGGGGGGGGGGGW
jgi:hypothetical protein